MFIENLEMMHHKSVERIDSLGEVYTPIHVATQMCDFIPSDDWKDPCVIFFEPTCGNGNILEVIVKRRLECLYEVGKDKSNPYKYAISNAMNTLVAMDIDNENVLESRERIQKIALEFYDFTYDVFFYNHFRKALILQIQENEMISALSGVIITKPKKKMTKMTQIGLDWVSKNGMKKIEKWTYLEKISSEDESYFF